MSSEALPIGIHQFSEAIKDLPLTTLHLKAAEIRNSIAHLDYSNEQLKPFASPPSSSIEQPDPVCIEAIQENEGVISRMSERLAALKTEVESRGASWLEFMSAEEVARALAEGQGGLDTNLNGDAPPVSNRARANGTVHANTSETSSNPWTDGTLSTGRLSGGEVIMDSVNGRPQPSRQIPTHADTNGMNGIISNSSSAPQNGGIGDEEMRRRMEERLRESMADEEDGMHL